METLLLKNEVALRTGTLLLKINEVALCTGWSQRYIYKLMNQGLPYIKSGRTRRIHAADLQAFIDATRVGNGAS